ncbi:MAG: DNA topoisomerase IB, partial [Candidatus Dormibacteraeota bacterium]|nr:DNA topoisomerase IB [Candidatus Dormibacteraeota bacterium]
MGRSRSDTTERSLKVRPPEAAEAGLVYASDFEPGIRRLRKGKGFTYFDPAGKRVTDQATLERIRNLVIPPAWKEV